VPRAYAAIMARESGLFLLATNHAADPSTSKMPFSGWLRFLYVWAASKSSQRIIFARS
jgi:hypothetical protein